MTYKYKDCKKLQTNLGKILKTKDKMDKDWYIVDHKYCNYCDGVYHDICEDSLEKINHRVFNIKNVKDASINDLNNLKNYCLQYIKKINNNEVIKDEDLEKFKTNTETIYSKLKECKDYRISHHKNCIHYNGQDKNQLDVYNKGRGDSNHKYYIDTLEEVSNTCFESYTKLRNKKKILSRKYKSKSPNIKNSNKYIRKLRSKNK